MATIRPYGNAALALLLLLLPLAAAHATPADDALPLVSTGRYVEAQALLAPFVEAHPEDLGAHYWLGRALLGAGQRVAAIDQFNAVLDKKPGSADTRFYLAQALWEQRRPGEAMAQLQELLRRDADNTNAAGLLERIKQNPTPPAAIASDLSGGQVAFVNGGLPIDPAKIDLESYNFKDYTFANAPTEWMVTCGIWDTTNRWTCTPTWAWYGGYQLLGPAAIWTKEEFAGDEVVDTYFGFQMNILNGKQNGGQFPMYKGGNDVCISMDGDGANPSSGYTFMLGANHNADTRIMKGTRILASTSDAEALLPDWNLGMPSTYQWHRHWWSYRAVKSGTKLQLWFEGKMVLEAQDPDPLPSGRTSLWTYDNGVLLPRIRIYYQGTVRPRTEPAGQAAWIDPVTSLGTPPLTVTCASHPSIQNDFEYNLGTIRTLAADTGALLNLVPGGPSGSGHSLAVINRMSGGNFGFYAMPEGQRLDAHDYSRLSFDYRLPPEAKVNICLDVHGEWFEIQFSGLPNASPRTQMLGKIDDVVADNQWHHAEFDLLGALEQALGAGVTPSFELLHFANFNNDGYLCAGFGGNPAGCTYYLDNFYLGAPRKDTTVKLAWQLAPAATYSGYAVSVDQNPLGAAGKATGELPAQVTAPGPGLWYVHAAATRVDGSSAGTVNYAVRVAGDAPRVAGADPSPQAPFGGGSIAVQVDDPGGTGIDPHTVAVDVNGKTLKYGDPGLTLDLQDPSVIVDPALAGITLKDGGSLTVKLASLADRAGVSLAQPASYTYTYSLKAVKQGPPAPTLALPEPDLINLDFEHDLGGVTPWGGDDAVNLTREACAHNPPITGEAPEISRDGETPALGNYSLRVTSVAVGGTCGVVLVGQLGASPQSFDAGKYRLMSFDYRIPHGLALDLALNVDGAWKIIHMTTPRPDAQIGKLDIQADNKWHHIALDLYDILKQSDPSRSSFQVLQVIMSNFGILGNDRYSTYHLDNVRISPVVTAAGGLQIAWQSPDVGGISAVAYSLDQNPPTTPPQQAVAADNPLKLDKITDFAGYLSVRTRDAAGNWSPTTTRRVLIDSTPPTATVLEPAPNAHAAPTDIRVALKSPGVAGIDPASIVLSVAGTDYRVNGRELRYDYTTGTLDWSPLLTSPRPIVFPNGQQVSVALKSVKDLAGNQGAELPQWTWTMDYSKAKAAAGIMNLVSPSHPTFLSETFESGLPGQVVAVSGCTVQVSRQNPASGQYCVAIKKTAAPMEARLVGTEFPADKYPMLYFDYKLNAAVRVNLVVQMNVTGPKGVPTPTKYIWALTGPAAGAVGQVPGVQADGQWHHAYVNLAPALRNAQPQGALQVTDIELQEMGGGTPIGAEVDLDNLIVAAAGYGPVVFRWQAADPTGIKGYSFILTQNPAEQPPAQSMDQALQHTFATPAPGVWFLRIRAQNGAGIWGQTETYAVVNRNPV